MGESYETYKEFLALSVGGLPDGKPRYVMGIGTPPYIFDAVAAGADLFDCVYPTRIARNALAFTRDGTHSLRWESNRLDDGPIDPECGCPTCRKFSRSYLRHLVKAREILAPMLITYHNLSFMQELVEGIRKAVREGSFQAFKGSFLSRYLSKGDPMNGGNSRDEGG